MKIAFLISTFPPKVGGMGQVAYEEAKRLATHGHEVTVFTLDYPDLDLSFDLDQKFKIVRLRSLRFGDAGFAPQLICRLKGFDLVHLHYPFYGSAHCAFMAKVLNDQKYLLTYHMDARPVGFLKKFLQKVYDFLWAKVLLKNAVGIITVDREHLLAADYIKFIAVKKVIEISNAVDTNIFTPELGVSDSEFLLEYKNKNIILFVGNPLPFKRLDFLLQAIPKLTTPNTVLLINSGGYEIEKYKKIVDNLGVNDKVKFIGRQKDQSDLAKLYRRAQCLVVPSTSSAESFSLVALEAQACGCPVIVSNVVGIRNRVDNNQNGYWFQTDSVDDLVQKIDQLLNLSSEQRLAFRQHAYLKVSQNYSWDKHVADLEKYYQSLC
ncbi:MAG: glycosyl transferase group 1 [uncultured bacterium]|nr:MAG: glycosyl transferase group 1 [uncultured bacterium]